MDLILLNPGPVTLSARVREAMQRPDLCHREPEFSALQSAIRRKLLAVYGLDESEWAAVLLTGSGTAAVEAMIASLVPREGELVAIENGVYGERIARIAEVHGIRWTSVRHGWDEAIDGARVERAVRATSTTRGRRLAAVHHETTTGRLNRPVSPLPLLLDAVSSFGAEEIDFDGWRVDACAGTAGKCLHGAPGAAFVVLRRTVLEDELPARSVYLDLAAHCRAQDAGGTSFTPSIPTFYALDEALDELADAGGWRARRERYRAAMREVRDHLVALGVEPLLADGASSCVLNAFRVPDSLTYATLHDELKRRGFVIYAGQGRFDGSVFRISVMGELEDADLDRLLDALRAVLG